MDQSTLGKLFREIAILKFMNSLGLSFNGLLVDYHCHSLLYPFQLLYDFFISIFFIGERSSSCK